MSSLLHPIHATATKCRPKHQVLVLKCYPRYQKNVQEVKANSSELSYLLYYASTRRSKLQKVGAFLEKKTASDVWRGRLGNVQVTLQIVAAIIEKAPRDLSLYSRYVLSILDSVLRSKDINMVEESIPTFEAYCRHADPSALTADQQRAQQYLSIVEHYASFASKARGGTNKAGESIPVAIRWRTAGLRAIRALVGSDALAAESSRQLSIVMPVILDNLSLQENDILTSLQQRATTGEKQDTETARRRRLSIATVSTVDTFEGNPAEAVETTADADKVAESEVRVLAVRCLKQIFSVGIGSTRGQTRLATALTLKFIASKKPPPILKNGINSGNWATSLFETIARWTPVQDRFIIVVTAMETLTKSPIVESLLENQLVLASMIDWLLSSSVNLIGLSVMDVLLGFIQHTLLLLQLGGRDSKIVPHQQQTTTLGLHRELKEAYDPSQILTQSERGRNVSTTENKPSAIRQDLLNCLERCISSLSNHIYYTDQITDMITAILARLKPSPQSEISTTAAAINNPAAATKAIAESASLNEDPTTDGFFSFATARLTALKAIKDILIRANNRRTSTGASLEVRSRVAIHVWEGTQWLLKDQDKDVRTAYVDALLTWLKLETNRSDSLLPKAGPRKQKNGKRNTTNGEVSVAKRAVSNASKREVKPSRSSFLQLLHLAIYDSILEEADFEADILILYHLLSKLVERLGVNAIRPGLPMIMRLQETALKDENTLSPVAKVHIASLVHGYLWTIAEKFDFEASRPASEVNSEISRRKKSVVWMEKINFPALSIDRVMGLVLTSEKPSIYDETAIEALKPFLSVLELVDEIANAYDESLVTPAASPPSSPGRVFSVPTLGFGYGYGFNPAPRPSPEDQLPQKVKDEMMSAWSREACIAAVDEENAGSITGSRTGTSSGPKYLPVNGQPANGSTNGADSPTRINADGGLYGGLGHLSKIRRTSTNGSPQPVTTTSSQESTVRVGELKRALSGYHNSIRQSSPLRRPYTASRRSIADSDTDSMVSWNETDEREFSGADFAGEGEAGPLHAGIKTPSRPATAESKSQQTNAALATAGPTTVPAEGNDPRLGSDIPPVPKIPSTLYLPGNWPRDVSPSRDGLPKIEKTRSKPDEPGLSPKSQRASSAPYANSATRASRPTSRMGAGSLRADRTGATTEKFDVNSLLAGIYLTEDTVEPDKVHQRSKRLSKPPY